MGKDILIDGLSFMYIKSAQPISSSEILRKRALASPAKPIKKGKKKIPSEFDFVERSGYE